MNFRTMQTAIINFIKNNYNDTLTAVNLPAVNNFIYDYIDLDKYKGAVLVFFDFTDYNFSNLSLSSQELNANLHLYIVLRNFNANNLQEKLADYTTAFYNFFYGDTCGRNFGGVVDNGLITGVDFYNAALGNQNIKVADLVINFNTEDF